MSTFLISQTRFGAIARAWFAHQITWREMQREVLFLTLTHELADWRRAELRARADA